MNNTELEEKLFSDHRIRDIVGGVSTSDALPIHAKKRSLLHIVNTDPSYTPGKHWLVIYIGEDGLVEYFDPLAIAEPRDEIPIIPGPIVEPEPLDEIPIIPVATKAKKERRRARQFQRDRPMKGFQIKLKKLAPLARGNWTKLPSQPQKPSKAKKERRRARQFRREEFPMKGLQIKLKKLAPLARGNWTKLPSSVIEVGERLRVKLPGVSKKLKAIKGGSKNLPIDLESSPEYVLQDPTPAPTVLQHLKHHRPVRKFAAVTPMQASQYFKN